MHGMRHTFVNLKYSLTYTLFPGGNRSQNERGPRPELKPKPTTRKVQENIISRDTHEQDAGMC